MSKIDEFAVIGNFLPNQFNAPFNLIIIDVPQHYSQLNDTDITQLYRALKTNSKNIIFLGATDYSFIKNASFFAGEKIFNNFAQILIYYNFSRDFKRVSKYFKFE